MNMKQNITFYSTSKAETVINVSDIDDVFKSYISISKYKPLSGSSYIKLQKELDRPSKEKV